MSYLVLKLVHLVSVILWIGPPLGAYYVLYRAHREGDAKRILWAERTAERVLVIEHIAFLTIVASGFGFVWLSDGAVFAFPWLQKKLWLFGGVVLFELFDIWLAHVFIARALKNDEPLDGDAWRRINQLRIPLVVSAAIVGLVLIPGILYFAVGKV